MAGSWIKLRVNLWDDPRVSRLCDLTEQSEATVIGGLYRLWAIADEHSTDGRLPGLTVATLNRKTGIDRFGESVRDVGWLEVADDALIVPRFDEHNGQSAKQRAQAASRQDKRRGGSKARDSPPVTHPSRSQRDNSVTREEESRTEKTSGVYARLSLEDLQRESLLFDWFLDAAGSPDVPVTDCDVDLLYVLAAAERALQQHAAGKVKNPVAVFVSLVRERKDFANERHDQAAQDRLKRLRRRQRGHRPQTPRETHPDLKPPDRDPEKINGAEFDSLIGS